ncbi:transposase [Streptomyces sp. CA-256286]|uniref:transposase n=1 Tax=Streptomyces sp. CA-256286 TaxID=2801033 RepID=UPI001A97E0D8|nr:transposase [Streptomyces sp. CA-256286]QTA37016.1 DDE superfamily endonuclease [Streptomyces sp. CA-256286]
MSLLDPAGHVGSLAALSQFRTDFHDCLTGRADALFELTDAVLCTDGPVRTLVGLALAPEHRRGHGALYAGLNRGRIDFERLRRTVAGLPLPRAVDGRLVLAADVSPWLRPDANTSPDRSFCHTYGRGKNEHKMIPGWPYSVIAALEVGRTSWTALLDAVRLEPGADAAAVTTVQVREVVERLMSAGQWKAGDPDILLVLDAGYDVQRLSFLLADLPLELLGRLRSDRVMRRPTPPRVYAPKGGRPPKHGGEFVFGQPDTWGEPDVRTTTETSRYGTAVATAFDRLHPRLTRRWSRPKLRSPEAADRWTWLVIAAHTQLRLVRGLAADLRRPWERPAPPNKLTPARVRRGFRNLRTAVGSPAGAPKPTKAGPGRPPGLKNRRPAAVRDVGRVLKTGEPYSRPAHHKQGTKPRRVSD